MRPAHFLPTLQSLLKTRNVPLIHRDLSWMQFNERVLAEARPSSGNPLFERVKFLAISASNLDEFFMVRVASMERSINAGRLHPSPRRRAQARRLLRVRDALLEAVSKFGTKQAESFELLHAELAVAGIFLVRQAKEGTPAFEVGQKLFEEQVLPKLPKPEPFSLARLAQLGNLQMAVLLPGNQLLTVPKGLPTVLHAPGKPAQFFTLDGLLAAHLGPVVGALGPLGILRLTRDSDIDLGMDLRDEDPMLIPERVRQGLHAREKGRPVRLQYVGDFPEQFIERAARMFRLTQGQVYQAPQGMCLHGLWTVVHELADQVAGQTGLVYPPLAKHVPHLDFTHRDHLLHHPYDSFEAFVAWVQKACDDPLVESVEQTIYRMDAVSPIIGALKRAALTKRVRVVIELRARFDEMNNLALAEELKQAGVEVAFGFGKLKIHAKIALVARKEAEGLRYYTHLSTGNYNTSTARQYTDLAILTADAEIGQDARYFFDSVFSHQVPQSFKRLVSAPTGLHRRLLSLIQRETASARSGRKARIFAKVNALVDERVIENLYLASQAGVQVDLVVRGACSLVPGVKGLSDNIRVVSIVDRFLEHSRIYYFESSQTLYLSSADWMPRNFFSRLETAFPVLDPKIYSYLRDVVLPTYLGDSLKARELTPQGTWKKIALKPGMEPQRSQFVFSALAARGYVGTPLVEAESGHSAQAKHELPPKDLGEAPGPLV